MELAINLRDKVGHCLNGSGDAKEGCRAMRRRTPRRATGLWICSATGLENCGGELVNGGVRAKGEES